MRLTAILMFSLILGGTASRCVSDPPDTKPKSLILHDVTVIDATGAPVWSAMDVVITRDRVTEITPIGQAPEKGTVVDASGKFLIPGLWDEQTAATKSFAPP
jgi:N-acyl-D-aspartate/D-glutamate deacylase